MRYVKQKSINPAGPGRNDKNTKNLNNLTARLATIGTMICLSIALGAAPAMAGTIVIDDFLDTARTIWDIPPDTFNPPGDPSDAVFNMITTTSAVPAELGGQRDLLVEVDPRISPLELRDATGVMGNGAFKFLSASSAGVYVSLLYEDTTGGGQTLDLVDGTNIELQFHFDSLDGGVGADFIYVDVFISSDDGVTQGEASWFSDENPSRRFFDSATDVVYSVPFSEFVTDSGTIDFSNVTSIQVDFNFFDPDEPLLVAIPGVDFKLTSIVADIPEPTSLALAAIGLMAVTLGSRRRRGRN